MMETIIENAVVARLAAFLPRTPRQLNGLQESDAELVLLPGSGGQVLALTTDSIAEEIASGLYADPYLAGWMTVMANLSDLAAVGAEPIGLLIAETLPQGMTEKERDLLQTGIRDACLVAGSHVLGGDTNYGGRLQLTGTAVGLVPGLASMRRIGSKPGDLLFSTGKLGVGNAFAAERLSGTARDGVRYLPIARLREGRVLRSHASACMDTSDGLFSTLDQLGRLNDVGFELCAEWSLLIDFGAQHVAEAMGLPPWMLFAGPHGEFELVFTVHPQNAETILSAMGESGMQPVLLGRVCGTPGIALDGWGRLGPEDLADIRNRPFENQENVREFIVSLFALEARCRTSTQA